MKFAHLNLFNSSKYQFIGFWVIQIGPLLKVECLSGSYSPCIVLHHTRIIDMFAPGMEWACTAIWCVLCCNVGLQAFFIILFVITILTGTGESSYSFIIISSKLLTYFCWNYGMMVSNITIPYGLSLSYSKFRCKCPNMSLKGVSSGKIFPS